MQDFHTRCRNGTEVCEICGASKSERGDLSITVQHLQRLEPGAEKFEGSIQPVQGYLRTRGVGRFGIEDVGKHPFDDLRSLLIGVERKFPLALEGERTKVVEAEDMIGMAVSVENGVDAPDILSQGLRAEIWRRIDEHEMHVVSDQDRGPSAPSARGM